MDFTEILRLDFGDADALARGEGVRSQEPMIESTEHGAKILVAEDQPEVQHALQLLLKMDGHHVELASSPDEALASVASADFDLLLIDLNYHRDTTSGAEGLKLLSDLRAMRYDRPVVAMTAWGSIDLAVEAMQNGACDFVQKPWDNQHLLRVVNKHVEAGRQQRKTVRRKLLELQDAVAVQRRLMPSQFPTLPGMTIAAECHPAGDMGGDYFDVFRMGQKIGICVADVVGKGFAAALMMSNLQAAVKVLAADWVAPSDLCARVNELVCRNGTDGKFISFFYALLDPQNATLTYCNCGHNAPIVHSSNGSVSRLEAGGTLLGLNCHEAYAEAEMKLSPGDRLVLFTDGMPEAGASREDEYGEERMIELIQKSARSDSAQSLLQTLLQDVASHCGEQYEDDLTCVVISMDDVVPTRAHAS